LDNCLGFHEQSKRLRKVPLQQKGCKTLTMSVAIKRTDH